MHTINIDDDVYALLSRGISYGITINMALRAVLHLPGPTQSPQHADSPRNCVMSPSTRPDPLRTDHGKLARLIDAGLLKEGQVVTWNRRKLGQIHTATVTATGHLLTADGELHLSPDSCSTVLAGYPCRSWKSWRTSNGTSLSQLRDQLIADEWPRLNASR